MIMMGARNEDGIRVENTRLEEDGKKLTKITEYVRDGNGGEHLLCEYMYRTSESLQKRDRDVLVQILTAIEELTKSRDSTDDLAGKKLQCAIKRAKKRFRHGVYEYMEMMVFIPDRLIVLARDIMESATKDQIEKYFEEHIGESWHGIGDDYIRTKCTYPTFVADCIPGQDRKVLQEAGRSFCHRLFRATFATCRCVIEDQLEAKYRCEIGKHKLVDLIDLFKCEASIDQAGELDKVRVQANHALHHTEVPTLDAAKECLNTTVNLVVFLAGS